MHLLARFLTTTPFRDQEPFARQQPRNREAADGFLGNNGLDPPFCWCKLQPKFQIPIIFASKRFWMLGEKKGVSDGCSRGQLYVCTWDAQRECGWWIFGVSFNSRRTRLTQNTAYLTHERNWYREIKEWNIMGVFFPSSVEGIQEGVIHSIERGRFCSGFIVIRSLRQRWR